MYIVYRLVAFGSVCRSVSISSAFGFFYRFRLLSTARLGIDKVSIAAVTNSAHVPSRGPWSVSFEVSIKFYGDT